MARILLIEPDRRLAEIQASFLTAAGYKISAAATAQAALQAADAHRPELVILELQLVEHSGLEFLYEFRSYPDWQQIPVLILSQVPPAEFNDSRQLQTELGVNRYLYKPRTSLAKLLSAVEQTLAVTVP